MGKIQLLCPAESLIQNESNLITVFCRLDNVGFLISYEDTGILTSISSIVSTRSPSPLTMKVYCLASCMDSVISIGHVWYYKCFNFCYSLAFPGLVFGSFVYFLLTNSFCFFILFRLFSSC